MQSPVPSRCNRYNTQKSKVQKEKNVAGSAGYSSQYGYVPNANAKLDYHATFNAQKCATDRFAAKVNGQLKCGCLFTSPGSLCHLCPLS